LEIRFIGASLLIIYEGDPRQLHNAWHAVDVGESRGDGLEDDEYKMDGGVGDDDDEEEDGDLDDDAGKGKPSFFSHVFGKFGADAHGAQGFGLLDGSPPPTPRRRRSQPTHSQPSSDHQTTNHQDTDEEEEEEDAERIPDADAHERAARPFTIRLIDFAHTRLADGEGPDEGVLLGLQTVKELIRGRIGELERPEGREVVDEQKMNESVGV
jgi:1D-myo-inositol-tetrakisphosphate 5-kinase/inositol-polyphosphate multikinase